MDLVRKALPTLAVALLAAGFCLPARAQSVTRGPYINQGAPTEATLRWRTSSSTSGRVRYGTSQGSLNQSKDGSGSTTEHEVRVTGLTPNTRYYYSIGTTSSTLEGGDSSYTFKTAPSAGAVQPVRVWIIGDAGTASSNQRAVRDAFKNWNGSNHVDVWLMLGDNAYSDGTDSQYQNAVFDMYPEVLRKTFLFPTRGNHERDSSPYYQIFTMPRNGESGGLASGSEAYYSYDYGNVHFICLDSQGSDLSTSGAMANWLRNDLAATTQDWIVAYWHHPPYSKGSHNSDSEGTLQRMRERFNPILEDGGVDMVFCGHSHCYERSIFLDGQYGNSSEFSGNPGNFTKDGGSGRDGNAYNKALGPHNGTVYTVAGSSGKTSGGSFDHPVMYYSRGDLGSVVLDFNGNRVDARFIRENGNIDDYWMIIKSGTGGGGSTIVSVSASDPSAAEAGQDPGEFTVMRSGDTSAAIVVDFTLSGSATSGADYGTPGSSVTIPAGQTSATITITPIDDGSPEGSESVILTVTGGAGYSVGSPSSAIVTINDNDGGGGGGAPPGTAFQQDPAVNSLLVIEAENYHNNISQGGHSWSFVTAPAGFSGAGAMEATPNSGTNNNTGYAANSPMLEYYIDFVRAGTYYVFVRGYGATGTDDSVHAGLDGQEIATSDRISSFTYGTYDWSGDTMDGQVAFFDVPSPGTHTLNVWMREDGFIVDKIVLTDDPTYTGPTGTGPAESPLGTAGGGGAAQSREGKEGCGATGMETILLLGILLGLRRRRAS